MKNHIVTDPIVRVQLKKGQFFFLCFDDLFVCTVKCKREEIAVLGYRKELRLKGPSGSVAPNPEFCVGPASFQKLWIGPPYTHILHT